MTVAELIAALKKMPAERQVILASDAEGNRVSPLAKADDDECYRPLSTYSGELDPARGDPCVVLWPTR